MPAVDVEAHVREFEQRGFTTIPGALVGAELEAMRRAFDEDRRANPLRWELRGSSQDSLDMPGALGPVDAQQEWGAQQEGVGESGRWQTEPLPRTEAFDRTIWHPATFPILSRLMGPTLRFHGLSAMSRDPVLEPVPAEMNGAHWQLWHREEGGSFAPHHPFCMRTCMVLYYLDDCGPDSHCFSVVPESLEAKKSLPWKMRPDSDRAMVDEPFNAGGRMWRNRPGSMLSDDIEDGVGRPDGVDVLGPAGTAIITNGCNIHAGTVRQSDRPRRSVILWWGHGPQNYTPRGQARQITKRHNNGHDMALPARLPAHPEWGWLFSQEPLSAEENWVVNGINPEAGGVAARL